MSKPSLQRVAENNGGFASVRTKNMEPPLDLSGYGGLRLQLKGNGLRFKCIIRTDANWDGIAYCRCPHPLPLFSCHSCHSTACLPCWQRGGGWHPLQLHGLL